MARESIKKEVNKKDKKATKSKKTNVNSTLKAKNDKAVKTTASSKKVSQKGSLEKKSTSKTKKPTKTVTTSNSKKSPSKKTPSSRKRSTSKSASVSKVAAKSTVKPMLTEYYDLPYRYNETTVKILAQTPTTLFVYWDISDNDRNALINKYGENFFQETKPILIVHNVTHNYSFELEINDFANSWYIRSQEPNSDYVIELGRKMINNSNSNEYIYISSSNDVVSPNNHVLFDETDLGHVAFKNVKTGVLSYKDFGSLRFINDIDKLYGNVYDVYSRLYKDELLNTLANPSSGEFIRK